MICIGATITVTRDDDDIEVELEGKFYAPVSFGKSSCADPDLEDWEIVSPEGIKLTRDECDRAEQALFDNF